MFRVTTLAAACGMAVLGLSACGALPQGVIQAPEDPLKFAKAKEKKILTEENPIAGPNLTVYRGPATTTNGANFAVVESNAGIPPNHCVLVGPKEEDPLNHGEQCTIGVEYIGAEKVQAKFQQKFGPLTEPERLVAEYNIES